jgi:peroxiredoxin
MKEKTFLYIIAAIAFFSLSFVYGGESKKVTDFTLNDYDGKSHTLSELETGKATVIMFVSARCPVSNAYNERMNHLYKDYVDKGIFFVAINSNKQEDADEVKEHAEENNFRFAVLKDPGNKVADAFDAQVTPEIYVVNTKLELLYHGRIDNSRREDEVESKDLRIALDEILAGKSVNTTATKAFGCSIKRVE